MLIDQIDRRAYISIEKYEKCSIIPFRGFTDQYMNVLRTTYAIEYLYLIDI